MPAAYLTPAGSAPKEKDEICLFAQTSYRNQMRRFGIKLDDRRRHMYIIGKTGMGKSTMMENMMLNDIYSGHGVGLVDPHGDFAEKIINFIPSHRVNDVVYINPSDLNYPIGFNILEVKNEEQKHLVAAGMMGTFKKIWPDVWSARMEYILNNTLLALLEYPGSTLLGINRLLSDKKYRAKVIRKVKDPVIKAFWESEFASYTEKYAQEAVAPIQNKIGQFLSASVIRNMVAQVKSTVDIRSLMDEKKIVIMNLSKGRIGEDNSRLLGGMLITKIQLSAMERVDTPEKDRKDFFLYVDEFQNFATPSFANILSEARKYRLSLIMAHQYVAQLDEVVADAVFGNVGTIVTFRVGAADAEMMAKEFAPVFLEEDIVNLAKFRVIMKLMIDGVSSLPFSALTLPPIAQKTDSTEKVVRVSRERYSKRREDIEEKIARWSGIGDLSDEDDDEDDTDANIPQVRTDSGRAPARDKKDFRVKPGLPPRRDDRGGRTVTPPRREPASIQKVREPAPISLGALPPRQEVVKDVPPVSTPPISSSSSLSTPSSTLAEPVIEATVETVLAPSAPVVAPTPIQEQDQAQELVKSADPIMDTPPVILETKKETPTSSFSGSDPAVRPPLPSSDGTVKRKRRRSRHKKSTSGGERLPLSTPRPVSTAPVSSFSPSLTPSSPSSAPLRSPSTPPPIENFTLTRPAATPAPDESPKILPNSQIIRFDD